MIKKFTALDAIKNISSVTIQFALAIALLGMASLAPDARGQATSTGSAVSAATATSAPTATAATANASPLFSPEARAAAESDPVLQAMLAEIERSKEHLKMDGVQAPYFIEYRVVDIGGEAANAVFGALEFDQHSP